MKKSILSASLVLASFLPMQSFAQQAEPVQSQIEEVETIKDTPQEPKCHPGKAKHHRKGFCNQHGDRKAPRAPKCDIFEGIDLTAEQQQALKAIHDQCVKSMQRPDCNQATCDKPENCKQSTCEQVSSDQQNCDQASCSQGKHPRHDHNGKADKRKRAPRPSEEQIAQRKAMKQEYLSKVKEVLTPEQYIQFLENNVRFHK